MTTLRLRSGQRLSTPLRASVYGGAKLRTETTDAGGNVTTRLYFGGFEFVDDGTGSVPESFQHPEGRVAFDEELKTHYQYRLRDHLGNTVVLFEDKNGDGLITSELDSDDPELIEVLERQFY